MDSRLSAAMNRVRQGSRAADVGTDHGRLALRLALSGKCERVYATDLREAPLEKARSLIARFGQEDKVICRLTNGLDGFSPEEVDDVIIAGMGGETIAAIVEGAPWLCCPEKRLILVPATGAAELRRFLAGAGFAVLQEEAAEAKGRFYTVISAAYTGERQVLSPLEEVMGALRPEGPAARGYLQKALSMKKQALGGKTGEEALACRRLIDTLEEVLLKCGE